MIKNKYLEKEWWQEWLRKLFPENYGTPQPSWNFSFSNANTFYDHWYKNGDFLIGICYIGHKKAPMIKLGVVNHPELKHAGFFNLKEAENEATFIKALSNHDLMPLAINVPWAKPFLEYFFSKK